MRPQNYRKPPQKIYLQVLTFLNTPPDLITKVKKLLTSTFYSIFNRKFLNQMANGVNTPSPILQGKDCLIDAINLETHFSIE